MRSSTMRRPAALGLSTLLAAAVLAAGAPALAQELQSPTFQLATPPSEHPAKKKVAPRTGGRVAQPAPKAGASTTIPMDFSGMARRGADLDPPKDTPDSDADTRPVIHNGLVPGASFKF